MSNELADEEHHAYHPDRLTLLRAFVNRLAQKMIETKDELEVGVGALCDEVIESVKDVASHNGITSAHLQCFAFEGLVDVEDIRGTNEHFARCGKDPGCF